MKLIERMKLLGVKQVDLILALQKVDIVVNPSEISLILRGLATYPKALTVLAECNRIVTEMENDFARKTS